MILVSWPFIIAWSEWFGHPDGLIFKINIYSRPIRDDEKYGDVSITVQLISWFTIQGSHWPVECIGWWAIIILDSGVSGLNENESIWSTVGDELESWRWITLIIWRQTKIYGRARSFVFCPASRAHVPLMIDISISVVFSSEDFYIVFVITHWCNVHHSTSSSFSCDNQEWLILRVVSDYGVLVKSDAPCLSLVVVVSDS